MDDISWLIPTFTAQEWVVVVVAVFLVGLSKGGLGGGAVFVATILLTLFLEPFFAVAFLLPVLVVMDWVAIRAFWKKWSFSVVAPFLLAVLPGVALGFISIHVISPWQFRIAIATIALAFILLQGIEWLIRRLPSARDTNDLQTVPSRSRSVAGAIMTLFLGTLAGLASYVVHAGSPPVLIYLIRKNQSKVEFQAATVLIFLMINLTKIPGYTIQGLFTEQTFVASVWLLPIGALGAYAGVRLHSFLSERFFAIIIRLLLFFGALRLLYVGLQEMTAG